MPAISLLAGKNQRQSYRQVATVEDLSRLINSDSELATRPYIQCLSERRRPR